MPTVPPARELVVTASGAGVTVRVRALVAVAAELAESLTEAVMLNVPGAVGVPETRPVLGVSVNPAGRDPPARDQV